MKKDISNSSDCEQTDVALLVTDQVVLKPKLSRRDKEDYFIVLKGRIHQDAIIILNKHALNTVTCKLVKTNKQTKKTTRCKVTD